MTEVPVICIDHLSDPQIRALMITDNKLTENAEWNSKLLAVHFKELSELDLGFSLDITGFTLDEIDIHIENSFGSSEANPADQIPPIPDSPAISMPGDLWLLDHHRLLCGDATKPEDFGRLMNGTKAAMCFTDPPYNVNYYVDIFRHIIQ